MTGRLRTRFAPSPTGDLHLGNARTALFAWLLARRTGGTFLLRIDDTDEERNEPGAEPRILTDLRWLGLSWDEGPDVGGPRGPYRQSERAPRHREVVVELLRSGAAYRCFCTPDELARKRAEAHRAHRPPRYDGTCATLPADVAARRAADGERFAVRLRRREGAVRFADLVRGDVEEQLTELDDFVVARADGAPIYNLATIADDHDMGITHVVRSRDHLSNTVRQILVAEALGWTPPAFAHVSLVVEAEGRKLSKRRGAGTLAELRRTGHLPEAVVNFLGLLGWHPGGDAPGELFTLAELAGAFALERCSVADGSVDAAKLRWFGRQHLARLDDAELARRTLAWVEAAEPATALRAGAEDWVASAIAASREGASTLAEVWDPVAMLLSEPATAHAFGASVEERRAAQGTLERAAGALEALPGWSADELHAALPREALPLVRLAVTGRRGGPPLHALLTALGRSSTVERLRSVVESLSEEDWSEIP